jgi:hypothetical protein
VARRSFHRLRVAKRKKRQADDPIQPHLLLPKESHDTDEDPLLHQYIKIGETALKNSSGLGEEDLA